MVQSNQKPDESERGPLILGLHAAMAAANERAHRSKSRGALSPLANISYKDPTDLGTWLSVDRTETDHQIGQVIDRFRRSPKNARVEMTASLTGDDFYLLCQYAKRCAAIALADSEAETAANGLAGLAMTDPARVDRRDVSWSAGAIRLALTKFISIREADDYFDAASLLAESEAAEILLSFQGHSYEDEQTAWLMTVIDDDGTLVIVERHRNRYEPTSDLLGAAKGLYGLLVKDGLRPGRPILGHTVGVSWLYDRPGSAPILDSATACIGLGASFRADGTSPDQLFLTYLFELPSAVQQAALVDVWGQGDRNYASLMIGEDRLAALFITRSTLIGVEPTESDQTLRRFAEPTRQLLRGFAQS